MLIRNNGVVSVFINVVVSDPNLTGSFDSNPDSVSLTRISVSGRCYFSLESSKLYFYFKKTVGCFSVKLF